MTIAITGASGHIGNVVCRTLIEKGHQVRAFCNTDQSSLFGLPVELVQGDVLRREDLSRLIEGCEIVINSAALISIHGDPTGIVFKTNTEGPKNVLEISRSKGVKRIIHLSSVHAVTELPHTIPYDETRPYKTFKAFPYDYSKAQADQMMLAEVNKGPMEIVVLRPSSVVGPFDFKPSLMGGALIDFYRQKIPALPPGGYDFVDVRDVAQSIAVAIDKGRNGEVYLLSGKYYTLRELARLIHKVTGKKVPGVVLPFWFLKSLLPLTTLYARITGATPSFTSESIEVLRNGHPRMDHSKASRELGHHCRPLEETLRDFYEWQKSNHFLK